MRHTKTILICFFISLAFCTCKKDNEKENEAKSTTITGILLNKDNNLPISGAIVGDENNIAKFDTTDINGQFALTFQLSEPKDMHVVALSYLGRSAISVVAINPGEDKSTNLYVTLSIISYRSSSTNILLPNNCEREIMIHNFGAPGSSLSYWIESDSLMGNFPDGPGKAILDGGDSASYTVSEKPAFVSTDPGGQHLLKIHYGASTGNTHFYSPNPLTAVFKSVKQQDFTDVNSITGMWSGTWAGKSKNSGANVNGTWTLDIQSVNMANGSITGTLTWNGADRYQTGGTDYTFDPNISLALNNTNTSITIFCAGPGKDYQFNLEINHQLPLDSQYGPWVTFQLLSNGAIAPSGVDVWGAGCSHCPGSGKYSNSNGTITGQKQ